MHSLRVILLFLVALQAGFLNNASAQSLRNFPIDSQLGKLKAFSYPEVKIDGQKLYLGAGSQIRDKNNLIILPTMMNETGPVKYQMDNMGNVHRIWLLSPEEAKQELAKEKNGK